ncbi:carboxypeptidase B-like [Gordionus sp. m RMFG-2023]|uniref:carboxypeptidase B-like n=1 Tax=Gordionus sp. m RMFG-2023 TaxID=3053472 RepID=UPI0031FBF15D
MDHKKMRIMIPELQTHFDIEKQKNVEILLGLNDTISLQAYNRIEEIYRWLQELEKDYPTKAKVLDLGYTWENRSIKGLILSQDLSIQNKPSVLIIAGEHAREWITTAVALNLIHYLLKDPSSHYMTSQLDWIIFPNVNPDGYEYSFTNTRLWRKVRSDYSTPCIGVDLNRNWDIGWGQEKQFSMIEQISYTNTCSNEFSGPHSFSEPETIAIRNFALKHSDKLVYFLSLHSYGQLIMFPNAYTKDATRELDEFLQIGKAMSKTIEGINGTIYEYGQASVILYIAPGTSMDWIYRYAKVKYSMVIELRNKNEYTFLLPQEQILPTSIEIFTVLKVLFPEPGKNYGHFPEFVTRSNSQFQTCRIEPRFPPKTWNVNRSTLSNEERTNNQCEDDSRIKEKLRTSTLNDKIKYKLSKNTNLTLNEMVEIGSRLDSINNKPDNISYMNYDKKSDKDKNFNIRNRNNNNNFRPDNNFRNNFRQNYDNRDNNYNRNKNRNYDNNNFR